MYPRVLQSTPVATSIWVPATFKFDGRVFINPKASVPKVEPVTDHFRDFVPDLEKYKAV